MVCDGSRQHGILMSPVMPERLWAAELTLLHGQARHVASHPDGPMLIPMHTMAQAIPTPSVVDVARPSSSISTRLSAVAFSRICAISCDVISAGCGCLLFPTLAAQDLKLRPALLAPTLTCISTMKLLAFASMLSPAPMRVNMRSIGLELGGAAARLSCQPSALLSPVNRYRQPALRWVEPSICHAEALWAHLSAIRVAGT